MTHDLTPLQRQQMSTFYNQGPPPGSVVKACLVGSDYESLGHHRHRGDLTAVIAGEHPIVLLDNDGSPIGTTTFKAVPDGAEVGGIVVYVDRGDPERDVLLEFQTIEQPFRGNGGDLIIRWPDRRMARPVLWESDDAALGCEWHRMPDGTDGSPAMPIPRPRVELCGMRGGVPEPFTRCADCDPETEHRCYWMEQCERVQSAGFAPEDYAFTAKLMRQHTADAAPKLFQAVCSNNLNIILAALDAMGDEP